MSSFEVAWRGAINLAWTLALSVTRPGLSCPRVSSPSFLKFLGLLATPAVVFSRVAPPMFFEVSSHSVADQTRHARGCGRQVHATIVFQTHACVVFLPSLHQMADWMSSSGGETISSVTAVALTRCYLSDHSTCSHVQSTFHS